MSKKCSYNIHLTPVINVTMEDIADPRNPTEEEIKKIVSAASDNLIQLSLEGLTSNDIESIELYEEDTKKGPLFTPVKIFEARPTKEPETNPSREMCNYVKLAGAIGRVDIQTVNDKKVANINLVTEYAYRDKSNNYILDITWHTVTCWEGPGKCDFSKLVRGAFAHVTGRIINKRHVTQDGTTKSDFRILANTLEIEENNK